MLYAPHQPVRLYAQYCLGALGEYLPVGRHERPARDVPRKLRVSQLLAEVYAPAFGRAALVKARVPVPLKAQPEEVYLSRDKPVFCKGLLLRKKLSVFVYKAVPGEDHVLRGFSMPRVRIYITADEPRRCGRHQQPSVIVFPYQLVRSREVRYHRCPRKTQPGRRRDWCPEILAYLHAEHEIRHLPAAEQQVASERDIPSRKPYRVLSAVVRSRAELALLIKLTVIRQHRLRHNSKHRTVLDNSSAVIELSSRPHRHTNHRHAALSGCIVPQRLQGFECAVKQRVGIEKIAAGVGRQVQLRKHKEVCTHTLRLVKALPGALKIIGCVAHLELWACRHHFNKPELHINAPPALINIRNNNPRTLQCQLLFRIQTQKSLWA